MLRGAWFSSFSTNFESFDCPCWLILHLNIHYRHSFPNDGYIYPVGWGLLVVTPDNHLRIDAIFISYTLGHNMTMIRQRCEHLNMTNDVCVGNLVPVRPLYAHGVRSAVKLYTTTHSWWADVVDLSISLLCQNSRKHSATFPYRDQDESDVPGQLVMLCFNPLLLLRWYLWFWEVRSRGWRHDYSYFRFLFHPLVSHTDREKTRNTICCEIFS